MYCLPFGLGMLDLHFVLWAAVNLGIFEVSPNKGILAPLFTGWLAHPGTCLYINAPAL